MKSVSWVLLTILMVGCAGDVVKDRQVPEDQSAAAIKDRQNDLQKINGWLLKGRIAYQAGNEGWTATLHWAQDQDLYNLRLIAPLGQGSYELRGNDNRVLLMTSKNELLSATDPEQLLLNNMGWRVPLTGMTYWVRGLPEPDREISNIVRDEDGRITDMEQSGWRISFLRYTEGREPELPEKIFMQNDRFKLRLVIQDWKIAS